MKQQRDLHAWLRSLQVRDQPLALDLADRVQPVEVVSDASHLVPPSRRPNIFGGGFLSPAAGALEYSGALLTVRRRTYLTVIGAATLNWEHYATTNITLVPSAAIAPQIVLAADPVQNLVQVGSSNVLPAGGGWVLDPGGTTSQNYVGWFMEPGDRIQVLTSQVNIATTIHFIWVELPEA